MAETGQIVLVTEIVNTVVKAIAVEIAQDLAKIVRNAGKIIISKQNARAVKNVIQVDTGQRKAKGKGSMKLMKRKMS